ncbi:radical SAM protein [Stenotrophomonas sp. ZAC14A_NAIMI4_1]|nr:radical SAM protein [Stenotrophomonas sp. ZAC14A_NAIMI4_1]
MKQSATVVFVSAGMSSPKKRDHALARRQLYLNYGVLSLATTLHGAGYDTSVVHGEHAAPESVVAGLLESGRLPSVYPLMLSLPSFHALSWARTFCALVRRALPACRIIVGGRWVVGPDPAWMRSKLPEAELFVPGLAEPYIEALLTGAPIMGRPRVPRPDRPLHHPLVDGYLRYQPSVEASRGCGMGCGFCEERDIPVDKLGPAERMWANMKAVQAQYAGGDIRPYLQASMFLPTARWANALAECVQRDTVRIPWRTESRVDVLTENTIAGLAAAGMKVLDLGLETASPQQIVAMKKSPQPERYLERASRLLKACSQAGVHAKVNVLIYGGETARTLGETRQWLDEHAAHIAGVSAGPVVAYGPPRTADPFLRELEALGARPIDAGSAQETGISRIHPSREIDAIDAERLSLLLSRRYMDADQYFRLKQFSYYPRDYGRNDFDHDMARSDPDRLPFRTAGDAPAMNQKTRR